MAHGLAEWIPPPSPPVHYLQLLLPHIVFYTTNLQSKWQFLIIFSFWHLFDLVKTSRKSTLQWITSNQQKFVCQGAANLKSKDWGGHSSCRFFISWIHGSFWGVKRQELETVERTCHKYCKFLSEYFLISNCFGRVTHLFFCTWHFKCLGVKNGDDTGTFTAGAARTNLNTQPAEGISFHTF